MTKTLPAIILVSPQMGENIGAAARSMLNFGMTDLRIVTPRDGWPNPKAVDMAKGAKSVIHAATIFDSFTDAIADLNFVLATTARTRDMVKKIYSPKYASNILIEHFSKNLKTAIVYGPERNGLTNDEISYCDGIISVPVSDKYTSLNLAQSVAITCYEFFANLSDTSDEKLDFGISNPAKKDELNHFFDHLENSLIDSNFFKVEEKRAGMMRNIRNMFLRANPTDQDVRTLRGMISSLKR